MIFRLLFIAIAIFFLLRILDWILVSGLTVRRYSNALRRIFPLLEFVTWTIFVIYLLINVLDDQLFYETAIVVVIAVILIFFSWFFLRDIIAGVIIKSEHKLEINRKIKIKEFEGRIYKAGYLSVELKTDSGEFIKIPFSKLISEVIIWPENEKDLFYKHIFEIKIQNSKNIHQYDYIKEIRQELLNSPWIVSSREPLIKYARSEDNHYYYIIEIFALNYEHARKMEKDFTTISLD